MKSYTITVNGNVYDVTVEETGAAPSAAPVRRAAAAPAAAAPAPAAKPAGGAGSVVVDAKAAGKVFKIEAKVGDTLKRGDTILVLEVMKMETPVVAPEDGTVASIDVAVGDMVESGTTLATLN
ncbi:MAG: acetyl-CoA carboxylase biotin carboxyl carrier protein subunit [Lachnospiraceae bacterium]|nr:acetyl-CoA carboxylase biotin carboxyl carrier protein subunit [Lachnospiraceae bacterium]